MNVRDAALFNPSPELDEEWSRVNPEVSEPFMSAATELKELLI
jgi:hypothetical protein